MQDFNTENNVINTVFTDFFYDRFLFLLVLIHNGNSISYIQRMHLNHYNQPSK